MLQMCPQCRKYTLAHYLDDEVAPGEIWECAKELGGCGYKEFEQADVRPDQPLQQEVGPCLYNLQGLERADFGP
jgi:hypothetical protein